MLITAGGHALGGVIELRRKDIAPEASVTSVRLAVTHREGKCNIDTPKSGKPRTVIVPPHIREDSKAHHAVRTAEDAGALLFPPAENGCHLNEQRVSRVLRRHVARPLEGPVRQVGFSN